MLTSCFAPSRLLTTPPPPQLFLLYCNEHRDVKHILSLSGALRARPVCCPYCCQPSLTAPLLASSLPRRWLALGAAGSAQLPRQDDERGVSAAAGAHGRGPRGSRGWALCIHAATAGAAYGGVRFYDLCRCVATRARPEMIPGLV